MDANGLRFWMLADRCDWELGANVTYDRSRRSLRLSSLSQRELDPAPVSYAEANSQREIVPRTRDGFNTFAYWDVDRRQVMAGGAVPGVIPIFTPQATEWPTDVQLGEQPPADERAHHADDDVADEAVPTAHHDGGEPARDQPDHGPQKNCLDGHEA